MKGWVDLVIWPTADGLPIEMDTHQLQVRESSLDRARHRRNLRGYEGYRYPLFGLRGTVPPLFKTKRWRIAVNRSDLLRLNYNKTLSCRGSAPDPATRAYDALPEPRVPIISPRNPMAPRSPSELVPPLFRPKLRPWSPTFFHWATSLHKVQCAKWLTCRL